MVTKRIPLELLVEADWNANRVSQTMLRKIRHSLERFGVVENLVARTHPDKPALYEVLWGNPDGLCKKNSLRLSFWTGDNCPHHVASAAFNTTKKAITHARAPDYVTLCGSRSVSLRKPWVLKTGCVTVDRNGSVYLTAGGGVGIPGLVPRAGWINSWEGPDPCKLSTFIEGPSATLSGSVPLPPWGLGPSVAEQWGREGTFTWGATSTELGPTIGPPSAEFTQTDTWKVGKLPWGLGW
jgi:hypothetical protein